ncbi:hypothetical protein PHLGIDRAFT_460905 [Phlebiopsis gigantea 11061_1 CR5-6]|uniref:Uncharacterized protein n=1 Tax=Phlebiopsis gigantea (strain 11061_1 CR5-6) TaxID=745531 RepID=A0A0C3RXA9_PHLG1|nr:hypothetical protein PHLGIDRAFT_460905 [Phlebiopsis gigantea 11061_1 CR5-6]
MYTFRLRASSKRRSAELIFSRGEYAGGKLWSKMGPNRTSFWAYMALRQPGPTLSCGDGIGSNARWTATTVDTPTTAMLRTMPPALTVRWSRRSYRYRRRILIDCLKTVSSLDGYAKPVRGCHFSRGERFRYPSRRHLCLAGGSPPVSGFEINRAAGS